MLRYYLNGISDYFKDNVLLLIKPRKYLEQIKQKPISKRLFFINIFLIVIIHFIFNYLVSISHGIYPWHIINTIGLTWQIFVFVIFVISFSPLLIDLISVKISKTQSKLCSLAKVYFHVLLIFAIYPLVNLIFSLLYIDFCIKLPFAIIAEITFGQIFEAILIVYLSLFIIYSFYRSIKAVILSITIIGLLFPLLLYGLDFAYFLRMNFYGFLSSGLMNDPAHVTLWCSQNIWFCFLIFFFGISYFLHQQKNIFKLITKTHIIPHLLFPLLILMGYLFAGAILPIPQLISLIIASIAAWNCTYILYLHYNKSFNQSNGIILNEWEIIMGIFWLITTALSFSLIVSFISFFFTSLFILLAFIFLKYLNNTFQKLMYRLNIFTLSMLTVLIASIPSYFFIYFYPTPSIIAIEWPTLLSFCIAFLVALIPSLLLKPSFFYPIVLPRRKMDM